MPHDDDNIDDHGENEDEGDLSFMILVMLRVFVAAMMAWSG